jgi:hypothetical protein
MASFLQRVVGAARLSKATYEEVEADKSANGQAFLVVFLSSIAAGVGAWGSVGVRGFMELAASGLLAWAVWALLTWFVGVKLMRRAETQSNLGELFRTIGFAASPGILRVLIGVPGIGGFVGFVTWVWMLVAMIVAVRQALDYQSTGRAVLVCVVGFCVYMAIIIGTAVFFGLGAVLLGSLVFRGATG